MGITIKDVAVLAKVSTATVSRVLTGNAKVSDDTADRVREVINRLGYQPDRVAQALRRHRLDMLGLICGDLSDPISIALVEALEAAAAAEDLSLVIGNSRHSALEEGRRIERMVAQGVDGVFVVPAHPVDSAGALVRALADVPVVQLERQVTAPKIDAVGTDHGAGIRQVVRHLSREGIKRIALLTEGSESWIGSSQMEAIADEAAKHPEVDIVAIRIGHPTAEFGHRASLELLRSDSPPEALVCGADAVAIGALRALGDVPGGPPNVAVTGVGGTDNAGCSGSLLTSVRLPVTAIAEEAVRLMVRRLSGFDDPPQTIAIAPSLLLRDTA